MHLNLNGNHSCTTAHGSTQEKANLTVKLLGPQIARRSNKNSP